jgi:HSP90 family molecular chaperone
MSNYFEGKSGVNVKRLVKNIADQYPFEPQIAAIVKLMANSLDAKASQIQIMFNKNEGTLQVTDDGFGMDKGQFLEYHNFAASTKKRERYRIRRTGRKTCSEFL